MNFAAHKCQQSQCKHTHARTAILYLQLYLHLHLPLCNYKLAVASALTAVCLSSCMHVCVHLCPSSDFLSPLSLPAPVPSSTPCFHVLVAAEQSLRSNATQNKFINLPWQMRALSLSRLGCLTLFPGLPAPLSL